MRTFSRLSLKRFSTLLFSLRFNFHLCAAPKAPLSKPSKFCISILPISENKEISVIITANGKPVEISGEISVTRLLEEIKVEMPEYVSVQMDDRMLLRADFDTTLVQEGAVVEFLYYMGGGQRPC
jgi:sulfur carrier protein